MFKWGKTANLSKFTKIAAVLTAVTMLACCGAEKEITASSTVDLTGLAPENIVVDGKTISVFDSDEELTKLLGNAYASDVSGVSNKVERNTIIYKRDEGNAHGMDYVSFSNCYQKYQGEKYVCFNGITGKSTKEDVKKILGKNCIKINAGENIDYFCYYIDGKEIDYSKVKIPDGFVDTMGTDPYGRAYCEDFITDGSAQNYIEWKYLSNGDYFDCICTLYTKA